MFSFPISLDCGSINEGRQERAQERDTPMCDVEMMHELKTLPRLGCVRSTQLRSEYTYFYRLAEKLDCFAHSQKSRVKEASQ